MDKQCRGGEATGDMSEGKHSPATLEMLFKEVGLVTHICVISCHGSDLGGGRVLVKFPSFGDARKAAEKLNGFSVVGNHIAAELVDFQIVIFTGLRDLEIAREVIRQAKEIGSVLSVYYPLPKGEIEIQGHRQEECELYAAAIIFTDVKSAKDAIAKLHGKEISGATVWAHSLGGEVSNTMERSYFTPSRLIDKQTVRLFSSFNEDEPFDLYTGPQIFNTVTWPLDGCAAQVSAEHLYSSGHQRLYNFVRGQILDVSSILGPDMVIFTTAFSGTFYWTITFGDYRVTLPIDGREGWIYGLINDFGCFEFYHLGDRYFENQRNWTMLEKFLSDYSQGGLCPTRHEDVEMGIPAARRACRILSEYKGELPVPDEVRKACATLITYGPEAVKSNEVLDWTCRTLQDEEEELTLGELDPFASRWSSLGQSKLDYLVRRLLTPEDKIFPIIPSGTGIYTAEKLLDSVCVIPYNRLIVPRKSSKERDWTCYPLDQGAEMARGRPHFLSAQFARPWLSNNKLAILRSPNTLINAPSILSSAKVQTRNFCSQARRICSRAGAALKLLKYLPK